MSGTCALKENRAGNALSESMEEVKSRETGSRLLSSRSGTAFGSEEDACDLFGRKTDILSDDEPALTERMRLRSSVDIVEFGGTSVQCRSG